MKTENTTSSTKTKRDLYLVGVSRYDHGVVIEAHSSIGGGPDVSFPLTQKGCRDMGAFLYDQGQEAWMYSSSADFPGDYKRGCKLDVRELVDEGYIAKQPPPPVLSKKAGQYCVCGNHWVAIAIHETNPIDSHVFTGKTGVSAFEAACKTYETNSN